MPAGSMPLSFQRGKRFIRLARSGLSSHYGVLRLLSRTGFTGFETALRFLSNSDNHCSRVIECRVSDIFLSRKAQMPRLLHLANRGQAEGSVRQSTRPLPSRTSTISPRLILEGAFARAYPPWAPRIERIRPARLRGITRRLRYFSDISSASAMSLRYMDPRP